MDVVTVLERSGGLSTRAALIAATTRLDVDQAVRDGAITRAGQVATHCRAWVRQPGSPMAQTVCSA